MLRMAKESQAVEKKSSSNKLLIIIIVLLLVIIGVGGFFLIKNNSAKSKTKPTEKPLIQINDDATIEIGGIDTHVVLDESNKIDMDELQKQADEGLMNLKLKNEIYITNGKDGECLIANAETNRYDMFVTLWLSETEKEIYRSGLIPIGSKVEKLELNTSLEPGEHRGILVYNQVENNKIIAQVNVEVTLKVKN